MKKIEHYEKLAAYTRVIEWKCDICGKDIENPTDCSIREVIVSCKTGSSYPEGGDSTEATFDLCVDCFKQHLKPWLESKGAVMQKTKSVW